MKFPPSGQFHTVHYDVYRMSRAAHFSRFSLTTELDSSLLPVSFRALYYFDINKAIDIYDSIDVYDFLA